MGVTQQGIAKAVGIAQRHLVQNIRPMIAEGLVIEHSSYALGGKQHRKVYFLTIKGQTAAKWAYKKSEDPRQRLRSGPSRKEAQKVGPRNI